MKLLVKSLKIEGMELSGSRDMCIIEFNRLDSRNDTFRLNGTLIENLNLYPYHSEVPGVIYEGQSLYLKKISGHRETGDFRDIYEITMMD